MEPLKARFAALALSSSLVAAGSAMAETAPTVPAQQSAVSHCLRLEANDDARLKGCFDTARVVDALKSGDAKAINAAMENLSRGNKPTEIAPRPAVKFDSLSH